MSVCQAPTKYQSALPVVHKMPNFANTILPSAYYDVITPEGAIRRLQSKISSTEALLLSLKLELVRQQRRLCPISMLIVDVLIIIFELCSEEDWRAPLSIVAVCREWRAVIKATPKAWCTLRLPTRPPSNIISTYLAHSKPYLLHLSTPNVTPRHPAWKRRYINIINRNSDRIKCLSLWAEELDMLTGPFPHLQQLDLDTEKRGVKLSSLQWSRFPSLLHINTQLFETFDWRHSSKIISPPPIQALSIRADDNLTWLKVLVILEKTLMSLRINAYCPHDTPMVVQSLDFPQLQFLEIIPHQRTNLWYFKAKTPSLRSYCIRRTDMLVHDFYVDVDFTMITHLHLHEPTNLARYPMVRHLQILFHPNEIIAMVESNSELCPFLESIEYPGWFQNLMEVTERAHFEREIEGTKYSVEIIRSTEPGIWKVPLPGQYPGRCWAHMGCDRLARLDKLIGKG